jgi:hypothetical protein
MPNLFCSLSMPRALNSSFLSHTPNSRRPSPSDHQQPKFFAVLRRLRCEGNAAKPTAVNSEGGALAWTLPLPRHAQAERSLSSGPSRWSCGICRRWRKQDQGEAIQQTGACVVLHHPAAVDLLQQLGPIPFMLWRCSWATVAWISGWYMHLTGASLMNYFCMILVFFLLHLSNSIVFLQASNQTSILWILYYVDQCNAPSPCCRKSPCRFTL